MNQRPKASVLINWGLSEEFASIQTVTKERRLCIIGQRRSFDEMKHGPQVEDLRI